MPEFATPYNCKTSDRKLSKEELIRAIRFSIAAEYEAIQLYEQIEEVIDNEQAKSILHEITRDEKVHAGNFICLLKLIAPEEINAYEEGREEAQKIIRNENPAD